MTSDTTPTNATTQAAVHDSSSQVNVFVSYSRSDIGRAQVIVAALEQHGLRCTLDMRDLPYGEKWQGELKDFIRACDAVLFLISPRSISSAWCKWELAQVALQSKRLVPAVIETAPLDELPAEISEIHLFPLTADFDLGERAAALAKVLLSDRTWVKEHTRLADRAFKWLGSERSRDHLLTGHALTEAEHWMARRPAAAPPPSQEQLDFIVASQVAAKRRSRLVVIATAAAAMVFAAAAGVAVWQRAAAVSQEQEAIGQRDRAVAAQARALAAQARALASVSHQLRGQDDPTKGTSVAIEALTLARMTGNDAVAHEAEEALLGSFARLRELLYIPGNGRNQRISFAPNGERLAVSGEDAAHILDRATGKLLFRLTGHTSLVNETVFSPDGRLLLTASGDETARLWNAQNGQSLAFSASHSGSVWSAAFSRDGERFLTATSDGEIRVFETKSRHLIATLAAHHDNKGDGVVQAVFMPDGRQIAAAYRQSDTFRIWDIATGKVAWSGTMHERTSDTDGGVAIHGIAIDEKGELLALAGGEQRIGAIGGQTGRLQIWDIEKRQRKFDLKGHTDHIMALAMSPDATRVITASRDTTLRIWDLASGDAFDVLRGHVDVVHGTAFSPDGTMAASTARDGSTIVWDATFSVDSRLHSRIEKKPKTVADQKFDSISKNGKRAVRLTSDYMTEIWDPVGDRLIAKVESMAGNVNGAELNPDGTRLLTAERNGLAVVWDAETGHELYRLAHDAQINRAHFSGDGTKIATAGRDGVARLWNAEDGTLIYAYRGHGVWVDSIAFSHDDTRLLTSGGDGRVRLWSVRSGLDILAIVTHDPRETSSSDANFSPDGKSILIDLYDDDELIVIDIDFTGDRLLRQAKQSLSRCLGQSERTRLNLDSDPPSWCITGTHAEDGRDPEQWQPKWPYNTPTWRAWLMDKFSKSSNGAARK